MIIFTPYAKWLVYCFWLPTLLLMLILGKKVISRYHQLYILATIGSVIIGFLWDFYAINLKIWYYPQADTLGLTFLTLPLEEWLFIFTIPSFLVSAYLLVHKLISKL